MPFKYQLILLGFLCGALSSWLNPYNEPRVYGMSVHIIMGVLMLLSAVAMGYRKTMSPPRTALFLVIGFMIAYVLRIVWDISQDSSAHNLLPLELILVLVIIVPVSLAGAYGGRFVSQRNK